MRSSPKAIKANLAEAARVGLEFGEHLAYAEARVIDGSGKAVTGASDLLCPYCGAAAHRDPSGGGYARGFCRQCAELFGIADATDCRCYTRPPTVSTPKTATMRCVCVRESAALSQRVRFHWRPDLYAETEAFVTQSGRGMSTNAPRWFAKHVDEVGDGKGLGGFDGGLTPPYVAGHDLAYFAALPEIGRLLGVAQFKAVLKPGDVLSATVTVDVDCEREDGVVETVRLELPAGMRGACAEDPYGDFVRLVTAEKLEAEAPASPYAGVGLYRAVRDIRLVTDSGAGCRFAVVADAPFLAGAGGVPVRRREATPFALQVGGGFGWPHLFSDAVGQVFLLYVRRGRVCWRRRDGLESGWTGEQELPGGEGGVEPWADKDARGVLTGLWAAGGEIVGAASADDGAAWA